MSNATFPIALPTDHAAINWETNILTAAEAAQLLQVPKTTVYKLAHRGIIPATKIGKHLAISSLTTLPVDAGA